MSFVLLPNSGQSLGQTRAQIRTNFSVLQTAQDVNHVAINASGAGKHKFLQMPEQGSAPATAANEGGLYVKEASSISNLFWRLENNGTEVQMTNIAPSIGANGYTFLPGGMLMQWGVVASTSSGTVTFPVAFSTVYSIQTTGYYAGSAPGGAAGIAVKTNGTSNFAWVFNTNSGSYTGFYWVAVGAKV